jgi:ribosome-associated translation inhibitor RaiA
MRPPQGLTLYLPPQRLDLHYGDHLRDVKVRLLDVNGPKGGVDMVCRIQARIDNHFSINTEGRHTDLYAAITLATDRMERSIGSILDASHVRNPKSRLPKKTAEVTLGFENEAQAKEMKYELSCL